MDNVVGLVLTKVGPVIKRLLRDNPRYPDDVFHHHLPVFVRHVRQAFVARDSLVGKEAQNDLAHLCRFADINKMARMYQIRAHGDIHHLLFWGFSHMQ